MSDGVLDIAGRSVGPGHPTLLVAELSANHNGSLARALETVRAARAAGADAVKFQTYRPETITLDVDDERFRIADGPWAGRRLHDLYAEAHTPWEWHPALFDAARAEGLIPFSTPFDETAVDLLASLDAPAYKVASFELVDDGLLRRVAATRRPVILSTGMASPEEIAHALAVLRSAGAAGIALLRCTSAYPAPDTAMHLRAIPHLATSFGVPVGLSDHSLGTVAPVVAVALGACLVEKHFTLDRAAGGPDSAFSVEPVEFARLVADVRRAEAMLGVPALGPGLAEEGSIQFRRSLFVAQDVRAGEVLTPAHVRSVRPGHGLAPRYRDLIVGRRAVRDARRGEPVDWSLVMR